MAETLNKNSAREISFRVLGEPASKSNSRRWTGKRFIKSRKALAYADAFAAQVRPLDPLFDGDVAVTMTIYYASRRPDLDESLILDLMQGRIYKNDRQVREKHVHWGLDRANPQTFIHVRELGR